MKMFVFVDGDKINDVEVDLNSFEDIKLVLESEFDCVIYSENDYVLRYDGNEVFLGISDVEYLWVDESVGIV